jgi:hypothetical protein
LRFVTRGVGCPRWMGDDEQPSCTVGDAEHLTDCRDGITAGVALVVEFGCELLAAQLTTLSGQIPEDDVVSMHRRDPLVS